MKRELVVIVQHEEQTRRLAAALAGHLSPGDVLCLDGALGAGKTTFVAALAGTLGASVDVTSPTFTLENRYPVTAPSGVSEMLHCDLYRPGEDARRDLLPSMLEARDEGAIIAVEWGAPVKDWLTPYLQIDIDFVRDEKANPSRRLRLSAVPDGWPRMDALIEEWAAIADWFAVESSLDLEFGR